MNSLSPKMQSRPTTTLGDLGFFNITIIRDVWAYNLVEELKIIAKYLKTYNTVVINTTFPGEIAKPIVPQGLPPSMNELYATIRANVNLLKLIQLGITLMDEDGNTPKGIRSWQFNFKFDLDKDAHCIPNIEILKEAGIDFETHSVLGINHAVFAPLFLRAGLNASENINWVTFDGGYDFAYLYKVILRRALPKDMEEFFENMFCIFPRIYDVKDMSQYCPGLGHGIKHMANLLNLEVKDAPYQAGFGAYLTSRIFIRLVKNFFQNGYDEYCGMLYGFSFQLKMSSLKVEFGRNLNILPNSLFKFNKCIQYAPSPFQDFTPEPQSKE